MQLENRLFKVLWFLTITVVNHSLEAQDGHYWTQHYGTKSILLSNSNIGGVTDLGAVYYNPGRLALIESPAFLLNADVFEYNKIKFEDPAGDGATQSETSLNGVPNFVAGTFKLPFLQGHHFAYSVIQRQHFDLDFDYRNEVTGNFTDEFPGDELFGGSIRFNQNVKEQWYSLTWSYPVSRKLSIGVTTSGARFASSKGTLIELQALTTDGKVAFYKFDRNFTLTNFALLWKIGLAGEGEHFNWGVTLTTPSLTLGSSGTYDYQEYLVDFDTNPEPYRYSSNAQEPSSEYKRPLALGAGISFPIKRSHIHLSGEWYHKIKRYTLLEPEPHTSQSSGDTLSFALVDELGSVVNFGIGSEIYLSPLINLYLSVSTDFSAVTKNNTGFSENGPVANNSVLSADFMHLAGGLSMNFRGAEITLGAAHTGGKQNFARPVEFPEDDQDQIFEPDQTGTFIWRRVRMVFSFSVPFTFGANDERD